MSSQPDDIESLITMIHTFHVGGDPSLNSTNSINELVRMILSVTSNIDSYRRFLQLRDDQAQSAVNGLLWLLQTASSLDLPQRIKLRTGLRQLSMSSNIFPASFLLPRITEVRRVSETPRVDIYTGVCRGRVVCMKRYRCYRLKPERAREVAFTEAIVWSTQSHEGIAPFLGVTHGVEGPLDPGIYLVSLSFSAGTVVEHLSASPNVDRCLLLRDVVHAMVYIHSNHVVHGNIRGANILVNGLGRACIADRDFSSITIDSAVAGSQDRLEDSLFVVPWKAPELLLPMLYEDMESQLAPATDVYALACLSYEVFTNKTPFWHISTRGHSSLAVFAILEAVVHRDERPEKPSDSSAPYRLHGLTAAVWSMMEDCWRKDPLLRPSAADLSRLTIFTDLVDDRPAA